MKVNFISIHPQLTKYILLDISKSPEYYYKGEIHYDWLKGRIITRTGLNYENKIKQFLLYQLGLENELGDNLMIILGGIGTGKSSTIKYILNNFDPSNLSCGKCESKCISSPKIFHFDFEKFQDEDLDQHTFDNFWSVVTNNIDLQIGNGIPLEEEITSFWLWCLKQQILTYNAGNLYKQIDALKYHIISAKEHNSLWGLSPEDLVKNLISNRVELIKSLSSEDLAWYKLFLLKYIHFEKQSENCKCFIIIFDNVDHLESALQKAAVKFSILITDILHARTIITIRPLTWARNVHSHILVTTQNHYSPSIFTVLDSRVNRFIDTKKISETDAKALKKLTEIFIGNSKHRLLPKLLSATSGISIRYALRNFANMLESPILADIEFDIENEIPFPSLKVSDFIRAYFFGQRDVMIKHSFENLYSINFDNRIEYSLIKPRILDFLIRINKGYSHLLHLSDFLRKFNYDDDMIRSSLVDLMLRSRPLLWCEEGYNNHKLDSFAKVVVSPIGHGYYGSLFGEYYYDEVCLADGLYDKVPLENVYNFHKEITQQDFIEIQYFKNHFGQGLYNRFYSSKYISISYIHWQNFVVGLKNRANKESVNLDFERGQYINNAVKELLTNHKKPYD